MSFLFDGIGFFVDNLSVKEGSGQRSDGASDDGEIVSSHRETPAIPMTRSSDEEAG
jgi:hypothetical protein